MSIIKILPKIMATIITVSLSFQTFLIIDNIKLKVINVTWSSLNN